MAKKKSYFLRNFIVLMIVFMLGITGGVAGSFITYRVLGGTGREGVSTVQVSDGKVSTSSNDASAISGKMTASVVAITTEAMTTDSFWYGQQVVSGAGSGVIMTSDGYILTCAHVINGANKIKVTTFDNQEYEATVVGSSTENDIAVIKIDGTDFTAATFADTDQLIQGQTVYAVGNPEGTLSDSITSGIISALNREIQVAVEGSSDNSDNNFWNRRNGYGSSSKRTITLRVIQTDAAVSPGNSGGGLFNAKGELIGIVSAKSTESGSEGLGFAIYGNTARSLAEEMIKNAK